MLTVVETPQFLRRAEKLFTDKERARLVDYLAANPTVGDEIVGSGGLRKVRFAMEGRGKSGGARVIYFFYSDNAPLYLITVLRQKCERELVEG
jgi:mRNA-degrading endonuclease RelE of RelBE toxin-antitoxin system